LSSHGANDMTVDEPARRIRQALVLLQAGDFGEFLRSLHLQHSKQGLALLQRVAAS